MNRADLIKEVASNLDITKRLAKDVVNETLSVIMHSVDDGKVVLTGFGTLKKVYVPERAMRNPSTNSIIKTKAKYKLNFKAGNTFKKIVN